MSNSSGNTPLLIQIQNLPTTASSTASDYLVISQNGLTRKILVSTFVPANLSSPPPIGDVTPNTGAFTTLAGTAITANSLTGRTTSFTIAGLAAATGGSVTFKGGDSSGTVNGGATTISTGIGGSLHNGGILTLTTGAGDLAAGAISIAPGNSSGTNNGATTTIKGGASGNGATGNGGALALLGGAAVSTNGGGGAASLTGGAGHGTGGGGNVVLTPGAGGASGSAGLISLVGNTRLSATGVIPGLSFSASFFGTPGTNPFNQYALGNSGDTVNSSNGSSRVLYLQSRWGGGASSGGSRDGLWVDMQQSGAMSATDTSTQLNNVAITGYIKSTTLSRTGQYVGNEKGTDWAINTITEFSTNAWAWTGMYGYECDLHARAQPLTKVGVSVVLESPDVYRGKYDDAAYNVTKQATTVNTFKNGFAFGAYNGEWAFDTDSTLIAIKKNGAPGAPVGVSPVARWGMDFPQVAFTANGGFLRSEGFAVDPTGSVGGLNVYGSSVTSRGTVQAQTASVVSIVVVDGGNFQAIPTLTIEAPPSGVTATATVDTMALTSVYALTQGTRVYTAGDVLTLVGGTFTSAATVTVVAVDAAGLPITFTVTTPGSYTVLPTQPVTLSGGAGGTAAQITAGFTILDPPTITNAGSGYAVYPPPLVTVSDASTIERTRLELIPQMSATAATLALNPGGGLITLNGIAANPDIFGWGFDGPATVSSGLTTLARDMHYTDLTVSGTGSIDLNGFVIYCTGTADLSNAPAGALQRNGSAGGNASAATPGAASSVVSGISVVNGVGGLSGKPGGTGAGTAGSATSARTWGYGGDSGAAGAGGAGGSAGGALAAAGTITNRITTPCVLPPPTIIGANTATSSPLVLTSATAGSVGGAGGGDGANNGGGSGAGGNGGGAVVLRTRIIKRSGSTAVGAIQAKGGNGGNGGNGTAGNTGGGAGSGAGGGGLIDIVCNALTGNSATNALDVSGGAGGTGGNGFGTGIGGGGGGGGNGGLIQIKVLTYPSFTVNSVNAAGTAGSTTVTATGAAGGAGATSRANL